MLCVSTEQENAALLKGMLAGVNRSNWWIPPSITFLLGNFCPGSWSLSHPWITALCVPLQPWLCRLLLQSLFPISLIFWGYLYGTTTVQKAGCLHLSSCCVPETSATSFLFLSIFILLPFHPHLFNPQLLLQEAADKGAGLGVNTWQESTPPSARSPKLSMWKIDRHRIRYARGAHTGALVPDSPSSGIKLGGIAFPSPPC